MNRAWLRSDEYFLIRVLLPGHVALNTHKLKNLLAPKVVKLCPQIPQFLRLHRPRVQSGRSTAMRAVRPFAAPQSWSQLSVLT
jgi:hypothetical protein